MKLLSSLSSLLLLLLASTQESRAAAVTGTFAGHVESADPNRPGGARPVEIVFNDVGEVMVNWPTLNCGNRSPLQLSTIDLDSGILEWTQNSDYGACVSGGTLTLTHISDTQWTYTWSYPPSDLLTLGTLTFHCSNECEDPDSFCDSTLSGEPATLGQCTPRDAFYPFGLFYGHVESVDSDRPDGERPVEIEIDQNGKILAYWPTLGCGNRSPFAPAVVRPGYIEWLQPQEFGTTCAHLGRLSLRHDRSSQWIYNWEFGSAFTRGTMTFRCDKECPEEEPLCDSILTDSALGVCKKPGPSYPQGTFTGLVESIDSERPEGQRPVEITFDDDGLITTRWETLGCGNSQPTHPNTFSEGYVEWLQPIEYGTTCAHNGKLTVTHQEGSAWTYNWEYQELFTLGDLEFQCSNDCPVEGEVCQSELIDGVLGACPTSSEVNEDNASGIPGPSMGDGLMDFAISNSTNTTNTTMPMLNSTNATLPSDTTVAVQAEDPLVLDIPIATGRGTNPRREPDGLWNGP